MVGLESVTVALFIEKKAALGSWSGTQREFAMKASVCAMKSLRIVTASARGGDIKYNILVLREPFPSPARAADKSDDSPPLIQPLGCLS